jgi:hypothetical protein
MRAPTRGPLAPWVLLLVAFFACHVHRASALQAIVCAEADKERCNIDFFVCVNSPFITSVNTTASASVRGLVPVPVEPHGGIAAGCVNASLVVWGGVAWLAGPGSVC